MEVNNDKQIAVLLVKLEELTRVVNELRSSVGGVNRGFQAHEILSVEQITKIQSIVDNMKGDIHRLEVNNPELEEKINLLEKEVEKLKQTVERIQKVNWWLFTGVGGILLAIIWYVIEHYLLI